MSSANAKEKRARPFLDTLIAGGTAGGVEVLIMYPTDTLKVRAQQNVGKAGGYVDYVRTMYRSEGLARFYRGIAAPLLQEPLKRSVKFVANRFYNDSIIGCDSPTLLKKFLCGFLAGSTEAITGERNRPLFSLFVVAHHRRLGLQDLGPVESNAVE